jgi:hypothetical protein
MGHDVGSNTVQQIKAELADAMGAIAKFEGTGFRCPDIEALPSTAVAVPDLRL